MPIPQDLPNYLKEIQNYLQLQKKELEKEYITQKGRLPQTDPFPELTQAINCVESLKSIQNKILNYWEYLES